MSDLDAISSLQAQGCLLKTPIVRFSPTHLTQHLIDFTSAHSQKIEKEILFFYFFFKIQFSLSFKKEMFLLVICF